MFQIMFVCHANADANRTSFLHPARASAPWFLSSSAIPHSTRVLRSKHRHSCPLDILAQPPNSLSVSLPHDHTAHEHLDRPNALKRNLALARGLVQTKRRAKLVFGHSLRVIDLVTEDDEGGVLELLHGEEGVELGFGFVETLVVLRVNKEDNAGDLGDCVESC
jgi:hypothetical protein